MKPPPGRTRLRSGTGARTNGATCWGVPGKTQGRSAGEIRGIVWGGEGLGEEKSQEGHERKGTLIPNSFATDSEGEQGREVEGKARTQTLGIVVSAPLVPSSRRWERNRGETTRRQWWSEELYRLSRRGIP